MRRFSRCPLARIVLMIASATLALPTAHAQQNAKPLPTRSVSVTGLWFGKNAAGQATGGTSTVKITVGGAPAGTVRIGFFEDEVGGSGDNWRAAGWAAATTAAQISEFNPYATQVSFDIGGYADGPSGGGLMTVGVLAAIRGDKVRSDAAMTGTINADGIIGPVGGIPYKIEGAAAAGKKLVVIPRGKEHEYHAGKKAKVNLVEHGRALGVDVRPVLDIYTAYALMTGKELPRPKLYAPPAAPASSDAVVKRRISGWKDRYMHAAKTYDDLPADCKPEAVQKLMNESIELVKSAGRLTNEGEFAAAYIDLFFANYHAYLGMEFGRNLFEYNRRGVAGAVTRIRKNSWLQDEINDVTELIETYEPKTFDQLTMYISACEAYFEALCCQQLAKDAIAMIPHATDAFKENLTLAAAGWQITAWLDLKLASNYMSMARTYGGRPIPADAPVWQLAAFYKKAYEANVNVLDNLYIESEAKKRGLSKDTFKFELAYNDIHFGIITMATKSVLPRLKTYFPHAEKTGYPYLATYLYLHLQGSALVTKYYTLGAQIDDDREIVGLRHERTFGDWLEWSEFEARRNIGLLKDRGLSTTTLSQIYEVAHIARGRDLQNRLNAMSWLYTANVNAIVTRRLAGISVEQQQPNIPASPGRHIAPPAP